MNGVEVVKVVYCFGVRGQHCHDGKERIGSGKQYRYVFVQLLI